MITTTVPSDNDDSYDDFYAGHDFEDIMNDDCSNRALASGVFSKASWPTEILAR